jgi:hypothetical protein
MIKAKRFCDPSLEEGPVLVTAEYRIDPARSGEFVKVR